MHFDEWRSFSSHVMLPFKLTNSFFKCLIFITDTKSNGNVFGVALSQCVNDDDCRYQDDITSPSTPYSTRTNRKSSGDVIGISSNGNRSSPTGSISSTNDSGCSVSPASPSSLHVR